MKSIALIQTCDGVTHATEAAARMHLKKAYSDALFKFHDFLRKGQMDVAQVAMLTPPYDSIGPVCRSRAAALDFLDANLEELHRLVSNLKALKDDQEMEDRESED